MYFVSSGLSNCESSQVNTRPQQNTESKEIKQSSTNTREIDLMKEIIFDTECRLNNEY